MSGEDLAGDRGLRTESSTRVAIDGSGEVVFAGDAPGPVVHRTPEELGLARVVPDAPARRMPDVRPDFEDLSRGRAAKRDAANHAGMKRDRVLKERNLRGLRVRMPAGAVMGAEMIEPLMAEAVAEKAKAKERGMPRGVRDAGRAQAEELAAKVLGEPLEDSPKAIAEKYGVPVWKVNDLRYQARKAGKLPPVGARSAKPRAQQPVALARTIDADPQREGTASAFLGALAKADAAKMQLEVTLQVTPAELARMAERMTAEQRGRILGAALKAALLAE